MSIYVIGDQNTILGFSLIGVDGRVVESADQARQALDQALGRDEIDMVLITQQWSAQLQDVVSELRMSLAQPILLEIPGSEAGPAGPSLRELVESAVGIELGTGGGAQV
jgi:V/A-type H+-transporting ATPase subunit F